MSRPPRLACARRGAILALALSLAGCSHLEFESYASFDEWYIGGDHPMDASGYGFSSLDGTFGGYVVNDLFIRTPVYLVAESIPLVLAPAALPYYGVRHLQGARHEFPAASEADSPDGVSEPAAAEESTIP